MGIRLAPTDEYGNILVWCSNCGDYEPLRTNEWYQTVFVPFRLNRCSDGWCKTCRQPLEDWVTRQYREAVSTRPNCDFISWQKPLPQPCPRCGGTHFDYEMEIPPFTTRLPYERYYTSVVCQDCGTMYREAANPQKDQDCIDVLESAVGASG